MCSMMHDYKYMTQKLPCLPMVNYMRKVICMVSPPTKKKKITFLFCSVIRSFILYRAEES